MADAVVSVAEQRVVISFPGVDVIAPLAASAAVASQSSQAAAAEAVTVVSDALGAGIETRAGRELTGRRDAMAGKVFAVETPDGRVPVSVGQDGRMTVGSLDLYGTPLTRDGYRNGLTPQQGARNGALLQAWGPEGAPAFLPVSPLRGDWGAFNLRLDVTGYRLGTVQASDLYICDVIQPLSGALATAVAVDHRPIPMTLFYGQSNAGRAGGAVINGGAVYPHHALMFSEGIAHIQSTVGGPLDGYGAPVTPGALSDLAPLRDNGQSVQGSHVAGLAAVAAEAMDRKAGRRSPARLWRSDYFGGQPLGQFVKGTTMYANALTSASQARVAAARYGRSVSLDFLVFVHGESGPYPYPLANLLDDLLPDLKAAADQDQAPFVILAQTNTGDVNVPTGVETAQLDYAKAHAATTALIPMYDQPLLPDDIHPTAEGRAIFGERVAWVQDQVTHGGGFDGVWPVSAVRAGTSLVVTFNRDIAADPRGWTLPVAALGFTYTGASITAATVTGSRQVTLTLSSAAAGTLHYANQQTADDDNGWSSQRGLIVHRTGAASPWQSRGLGVPAEIVVPAARFSMPIA